MSASVPAYLALGSNLGDRHAHMVGARRALDAVDGVRVVGMSRLYETEPIGPPPQDWYLNAVVAVTADLSPECLLEKMLAIERLAGRAREVASVRWGARTLDLDLLLYGSRCIDEPGLQVPHPRLAERRFVLAPLSDVAGEVVHPRLGVSIRELLEHCSDPGVVSPWEGGPGQPGLEA
jgi:2-amino-4-hydroxy-6-hydroxymethyldihydropteridine diphosphokinase